jgi:hypothetical protein
MVSTMQRSSRARKLLLRSSNILTYLLREPQQLLRFSMDLSLSGQLNKTGLIAKINPFAFSELTILIYRSSLLRPLYPNKDFITNQH